MQLRQRRLAVRRGEADQAPAEGPVPAQIGEIRVGPLARRQKQPAEEAGQVVVHPDALHEITPPGFPHPGVGDGLVDEQAAQPAVLRFHPLQGDEGTLQVQLPGAESRGEVIVAVLQHPVGLGPVGQVQAQQVRVLPLAQAVELEEGGAQDFRRVEQVGESVQQLRGQAAAAGPAPRPGSPDSRDRAAAGARRGGSPAAARGTRPRCGRRTPRSG